MTKKAPNPTITLFMAMSLNGFIAQKNGEEDFLSHENWLTFLSILKKHDGLIWGRRTYEAVQQWGPDYHIDIPIVVLSEKKMDIAIPNTHVVTSPREAVEYFRRQGAKSVLLSGGATTNTAFAKEGLIEEVIVNLEPVIIGEGISLFPQTELDLHLSLSSINQQKKGIITLQYSVLK